MIPAAAEEVALVVAVEEAEAEAEAEVEAEVEVETEVEAEAEVEAEVVVTPHRLRRFDRVEEEEEEVEASVFSTKPRCSNNWKRFCVNNNRRRRVDESQASRPRIRSRLPIRTDNVLR